MRAEEKTRLLEIGAGPGLDSQYFSQGGLEVICTDLSPENVNLAQMRGLDARVMDYANLDFAPASFEAVYAMSCLLHVPSEHLPTVLAGIQSVLVPEGLFYYGQWGGERIEGIYEDDVNEPKRFFCLYPDEELRKIVIDHFEVLSFEAIEVEDQVLHYQSFFLRKPASVQTAGK
jgi:SAM-dependent methyltransferase